MKQKLILLILRSILITHFFNKWIKSTSKLLIKFRDRLITRLELATICKPHIHCNEKKKKTY